MARKVLKMGYYFKLESMQVRRQMIYLYFEEGFVDIKSVYQFSDPYKADDRDFIGKFLFESFDNYSSYLCFDSNTTFRQLFVVLFDLLQFFVNIGWDFLYNCKEWLSALNRLLWNHLDSDECYDSNDKHYVFIVLEYILRKWDPDISCFEQHPYMYYKFNLDKYDKGSKQYKAVQDLKHLKLEQKRRHFLILNFSRGGLLSLQSFKEILNGITIDVNNNYTIITTITITYR